MRASSAAFHRSWWRRRTGFIADMYGAWCEGRRSVLRGNSCCEGRRRWRWDARRRRGGGRQRGRCHTCSWTGRGSDRSNRAGQQRYFKVAVAKSTFLVVATIAVRPLAPTDKLELHFRAEAGLDEKIETTSTHPATTKLTTTCESICLSSRYTGDSPLFCLLRSSTGHQVAVSFAFDVE